MIINWSNTPLSIGYFSFLFLQLFLIIKVLQEELLSQVTNQRHLQSEMHQLKIGSRDSTDIDDLRKTKELLELQLKEMSESTKVMKEQLLM